MVDEGEHDAGTRITLDSNSALVMKRLVPERGSRGRVSRGERVRL
jgi:hypothetical protein